MAPWLRAPSLGLAVAAGICAPIVLGCSGVRPGAEQAAAPTPASRLESPEAERRALLLLMTDQRLYDPFTVEQIRRDAPESWPDLALALGRIGDPRGRSLLEQMLAAAPAETRRHAALALGLLGEPAAVRALRTVVADPDSETGRLAIEALAKLGAPLVDVIAAADSLDGEELWKRLAPGLFRFPLEDILAAIDPLLGEDGSALHPDIAHGVGRKASGVEPDSALAESARTALRRFLDHPEPWARGWAARGLGSVGVGTDLAALRSGLDDPHPGPVIQTLRATAALIESGRVASPESWRPEILALLSDDRSGVRITALQVAGAWLLDQELSAALARRFAEGPGYERQLALEALAQGHDPRAAALVAEAVESVSVDDRATAARAAGELGTETHLDRLQTDESARVRLEVLAVRLRAGSDTGEAAARLALLDPDAAVRAAALEWLTESPVVAFGELALAIRGSQARRLVECRLQGIAALEARALGEPLERGAIVALLEILERDEDFLVRRAAGDALATLGRPRSAPEPVDTGHRLRHYRDLARRSAETKRVALETRYGIVNLRLECDRAPLTCVSFLQLVNQGFYDGLRFHRVVPDFVVQAGDPRGDGWGGPGFSLRDEPNLLRYERGVVGMAKSGPDTAGSQFFITLSRQPHLDAAYTAFGHVESGDDVLGRIVQGDVIERLTEIVDGGLLAVN